MRRRERPAPAPRAPPEPLPVRRARRPGGAGAGGRRPRFPLRVERGGLRDRRAVAPGVPRCADPSHHAGHRDRPAGRPATGDPGDARHDDRRPRRGRPRHHRHRRVRPPDRRGVVRPAVGSPDGPAARLHRDRSQGARPGGTGHPRRSGDLPAVPGARVDRPGQGPALDPAPVGSHPDLDRVGRAPQHRAVRGGRRRLVADGPRRRRWAHGAARARAGHGGGAGRTGSRSSRAARCS